jgi:hypothetical protein
MYHHQNLTITGAHNADARRRHFMNQLAKSRRLRLAADSITISWLSASLARKFVDYPSNNNSSLKVVLWPKVILNLHQHKSCDCKCQKIGHKYFTPQEKSIKKDYAENLEEKYVHNFFQLWMQNIKVVHTNCSKVRMKNQTIILVAIYHCKNSSILHFESEPHRIYLIIMVISFGIAVTKLLMLEWNVWHFTNKEGVKYLAIHVHKKAGIVPSISDFFCSPNDADKETQIPWAAAVSVYFADGQQ